MKGRGFIFLGSCMLLLAIGLSAFNIMSDMHAKNVSKEIRDEIVQYISKNDAWTESYQDTLITEMPTVEIKGNFYIGTLDIPKLELSLPIMDELTPSNLTISPCRYKGSAYTNDLILAAHNYRSHFSRIGELSQGDEIIFTDIDGNVFKYEVVGLEVLQPTHVDEMIHSDFDLTLFTCTYGGETRLTLRCLKI